MNPLLILNPKTVAQAQEGGWRDLAVQCRHCFRQTHIPWSAFPPHTVIDRIGDRLRCTGCNKKGANARCWMDEREFKRLQRMIRS